MSAPESEPQGNTVCNWVSVSMMGELIWNVTNAHFKKNCVCLRTVNVRKFVHSVHYRKVCLTFFTILNVRSLASVRHALRHYFSYIQCIAMKRECTHRPRLLSTTTDACMLVCIFCAYMSHVIYLVSSLQALVPTLNSKSSWWWYVSVMLQ